MKKNVLMRVYPMLPDFRKVNAEMILRVETRNTGNKTCPKAILSTANGTEQDRSRAYTVKALRPTAQDTTWPRRNRFIWERYELYRVAQKLLAKAFLLLNMERQGTHASFSIRNSDPMLGNISFRLPLAPVTTNMPAKCLEAMRAGVTLIRHQSVSTTRLSTHISSFNALTAYTPTLSVRLHFKCIYLP
jgi:hypothetical protein